MSVALVAYRGHMDGQNPLGEFLRARREQVLPEQVGLTPGPRRRRTPGLRREEVATLAGISSDYYLRIEQGRDKTPSTQVLDALCRVLLLDFAESTYLFGLVRSRPLKAGAEKPDAVSEGTLLLLHNLTLPAFVENRYLDVLAANTLATALSPNMRPGVNRLVAAMLDPSEAKLHANWADATASAVGQLRATWGGATEDPRMSELIGELSMKSERFRQLWAQHAVVAPSGAATTVHHPQVGDMLLRREKLEIAATEGHVLVIYHPEPGSQTAGSMAILRSLAAKIATDQAQQSRQN